MHIGFLIKGALTGIAIAAPVGPTTVLVIHRTIRQGFGSGVRSGLGAASADAFYGLIAAFGVNFIARYIYSYEPIIKLVGGCFLLFWGVRIFRSRFAEQHPLVKGEGAGGPFLSTFILTLTNPMTLLAFMAILAGLGGAHIERESRATFAWIIGLGGGSFVWWLVLSATADRLRDKFSNKIFRWFNWITGIIVVLAGSLILLDLLK
jgi:threonine/homoserine/homoserine lactone efflux protein